MAKTITSAFDFNVLFGAAIQSVEGGADKATAVAAIAPILKACTLLECVQTFMRGEQLKSAIDAGNQSAVERATEILQKKSVDVADIEAVRAALLPSFWTAAGLSGTPTATAAGDAPTAEEKAEARTVYNRIFARARRMAEAIAGDAPADVKSLRIPKALQEEINAMEQRLAALKAQHTAELVNEAKRRYADALKTAKAKAKKAAK